ncbi:hypothetical protein VKT23_019756 [Stygiomarasmius scandens]|uniref:Uncharacterized protein n=1 Tax=Marasmiellus scandens TaxID=2682957 RepID=A0ABR1INE4_9AGAR
MAVDASSLSSNGKPKAKKRKVNAERIAALARMEDTSEGRKALFVPTSFSSLAGALGPAPTTAVRICTTPTCNSVLTPAAERGLCWRCATNRAQGSTIPHHYAPLPHGMGMPPPNHQRQPYPPHVLQSQSRPPQHSLVPIHAVHNPLPANIRDGLGSRTSIDYPYAFMNPNPKQGTTAGSSRTRNPYPPRPPKPGGQDQAKTIRTHRHTPPNVSVTAPSLVPNASGTSESSRDRSTMSISSGSRSTPTPSTFPTSPFSYHSPTSLNRHSSSSSAQAYSTTNNRLDAPIATSIATASLNREQKQDMAMDVDIDQVPPPLPFSPPSSTTANATMHTNAESTGGNTDAHLNSNSSASIGEGSGVGSTSMDVDFGSGSEFDLVSAVRGAVSSAIHDTILETPEFEWSDKFQLLYPDAEPESAPFHGKEKEKEREVVDLTLDADDEPHKTGAKRPVPHNLNYTYPPSLSLYPNSNPPYASAYPTPPESVTKPKSQSQSQFQPQPRPRTNTARPKTAQKAATAASTCNLKWKPIQIPAPPPASLGQNPIPTRSWVQARPPETMVPNPPPPLSTSTSTLISTSTPASGSSYPVPIPVPSQTQTQTQTQRSHAQPTQRDPAPNVNANIKKCTTPSCSGLLQSESTSRRCLRCVRERWMRRDGFGSSGSREREGGDGDGDGVKVRIPSILKRTVGVEREVVERYGEIRMKSGKEQGRRVKWADGYEDSDSDNIRGWDSDLSELSDSSEEEGHPRHPRHQESGGAMVLGWVPSESSVSDSSSEEESDGSLGPDTPISQSTYPLPKPTLPLSGLKIRIRVPSSSSSSSRSTSEDVEMGVVDGDGDVEMKSPTEGQDVASSSQGRRACSLPLEMERREMKVSVQSRSTSAPPSFDTKSESSCSSGSSSTVDVTTAAASSASCLPISAPLPIPLNADPSFSATAATTLPTPTSSFATLPSASTEPLPPKPTHPPPGYSNIRCTIPACSRFLPLTYRWKLCVECRARTRKYQRKRLGFEGKYNEEKDRVWEKLAPPASASTSTVANDSSQTQTQSQTFPATAYNTLPASSTLSDPLNLLIPQARICSFRGCRHIIPPKTEWKWKMCYPCKSRVTRTRKIRQAKSLLEKKRAEGELEDDVREELEGCIKELEIPVFSPRDEGRVGKGRCVNVDCGVKMDEKTVDGVQTKSKDAETAEDFEGIECEQCVWRRVPIEERKKMPRPGIHTRVVVVRQETQGDSDIKGKLGPTAGHTLGTVTPSKPLPPEKPYHKPPYPEYQAPSRLLQDFQRLLASFFEAQSVYTLHSHAGSDHMLRKAKFSFDGEFSTVATDFDVFSRREKVMKDVLGIVQDIERVVQLKFPPSSRTSTIAYGGIITRFSCHHQVMVYVPATARAEADASEDANAKKDRLVPVVAVPKDMQGELEIVVLPVDSHRLFPGQRTVVRFRLVG